MRISERMRFAGPTASNLAAASALAACLWVAPTSSSAHELKEVSLQTTLGQAQLKLGFSSNGAEGDYPLYFQKADTAKGSILLSFLETESAFPLGRHPLEGSAPDLEAIVLKKITSPSGKNFLGLELKFKLPPMGDIPVQAEPKGVLKVMLGKGKDKFFWSLAKSLKEEEAYLSAKAVAPPPGAGKPPKLTPEAAAMEAAGRAVDGATAGEARGRPESRTSPGDVSRKAATDSFTPAVPTEPGIPKTESQSAPAAADAEPATSASSLTELQVLATAAQDDLLLVFIPAGTPNYYPRRNAKDSTWLDVTLDNVTSGLKKREYTLPKNTIFKRVKVNKLGSRLQLRIQLAPGADVQVKPHNGGLALSGLGQGGASPAFKWTTAKTEEAVSGNLAATGPTAKPAEPNGSAGPMDPADPIKSAHQEGQALESGRAHGGRGKGLSSSRIFSVGTGSKTMVLLKDSASLKDAPGENGKLIRKIPVGEKVEKVEKIGNLGAGLRVVSGSDTGYIRSADAVFADEVTPAQESAIRGRIAAKAAKLAAAEARLAAAAAKEEARQAAAAAKEAEKVRKADELAKKKAEAIAAAQAKADAKAQAKAQAKADAAARSAAQAAAQEPPAGIQETQAASRPLASKPSGMDPSAPPSANNPGLAAAGGPKLAIADNPELADKLAREKLAAEDEKKRVEPEENRIAYNSYGRRDPFIPVEQGASDNGIDIDQMKVVGIIWQSQQPMAVLEHNREAGVSFTVKEGDPVHNGRVARISRDAVTFDISEYGISRSYSLKLVSSKEGAKK
ncbi:MAG: hypothetical protein ABIW76_09735 [Fibrobacteria bacterium]